jgi:hypothetical protein
MRCSRFRCVAAMTRVFTFTGCGLPRRSIFVADRGTLADDPRHPCSLADLPLQVDVLRLQVVLQPLNLRHGIPEGLLALTPREELCERTCHYRQPVDDLGRPWPLGHDSVEAGQRPSCNRQRNRQCRPDAERTVGDTVGLAWNLIEGRERKDVSSQQILEGPGKPLPGGQDRRYVRNAGRSEAHGIEQRAVRTDPVQRTAIDRERLGNPLERILDGLVDLVRGKVCLSRSRLRMTIVPSGSTTRMPCGEASTASRKGSMTSSPSRATASFVLTSPWSLRRGVRARRNSRPRQRPPASP